MTKDLGGARIYLKREDLNHTGSHKINNALGQVLLAKKMGKTRVIAETGSRTARRGNCHAAAFWDWNARSTWERRIRTARHSMYTVWSC